MLVASVCSESLIAAGTGVQTTEDARFYQMSAAVPKPFSNKDKTLVLQYAVKFPQKIDCGGGYLKFGPAPAPGANFNGDTDYKYAAACALGVFLAALL